MIQTRTRPKTSTDTAIVIVKLSFVPSLGLKKSKISRRKFFRQSFAKNVGKIAQVKKNLSPQAKH